MKLSGKTVVITGASSGIGAATAHIAARRGARVILLARDEKRLKAVTDEITATGNSAAHYRIDLAEADAVVACARAILSKHGAPDVLVNNAGAGRWLSVLETPADLVQRTMAVPYFASFNLAREFLPSMIQRGTGHIVNVTSVASRLIFPGSAAYTAARWAVNGFHEALRAEVCDLGIGVTLAMFGKVSSEYWTHNPGSEQRLPAVTRTTPTITPAQAAQAIVNGIEKNKRFVLKPALLWLVLGMNAVFPASTAYVMRKTGWRQRGNEAVTE